jgi:ATP synthase subunit 6
MSTVFLTQPFEQFEIFNLFSFTGYVAPLYGYKACVIYFFQFTNFLFYLMVVTFFLLIPYMLNNDTTLVIFTAEKLKQTPWRLVSRKLQLVLEKFYIFIFELVYQQVGFLGQQFIPLFFTLFSFIILANVIGLIPYSFTLTSHIMLTFTLSFSVFTGLTLLAIIMQPNFFALFIPRGVPAGLIPFLFVIEIISYISRTFSLAIRLFANMMSGHVLLHIMTGFCAYLFNSFGVIGKLVYLIPFVLIVAIIGLEIGIAFLQAYVFCVLVSIYLSDVYSLGH